MQLESPPEHRGGRPRGVELVALAGIVLLAAVLRLAWAGVNSFAFDEAHLSLIALEMGRGGQFARVGMPSSAGVPNLPAAAWVFSLPYALSPDPLVATQFVGLLSLGVVIGTWALARRVWGTWAGLAAALFLAASPYAALYSRSVWAQNLLPVLGLAWGWTAFTAITRQSKPALAAHIFLAGFAFQVHFAGAALILPSLYFFLRFRWWRRMVPVLIGGGLALLALLPFVMEIACCRPDVLDQYRDALGGETQYDLFGFVQLAQIGLGTNWDYLLLGDLQPPDSPELVVLVGALLLVGILACVWLIFRARRSAVRDSASSSDAAVLAEIMLAWLVASPLFFLRHSTPVMIHYHLAALPALALLAGAASHLLAAVARRARWLPAALMLLVALAWTVQIGRGLTMAGHSETPNGLGTPLFHSRNAAYGVPQDAPVLFFTHGDDPGQHGEAAAFAALWWGRDYRLVQGESLLILPDHPAWLMATLRPFQAWEEIEDAGLAQAVRTFDRREGAAPFVLTRYDGETEPAGFRPLETPVLLADDTQLEGWKARRVGPRLRISTLWRVTDLPAAGVIQQFHHLRTAQTLDSDQPDAISDVPISAHRWQVGDRLIVMGDFFIDEAGPFWVDVGHYTLPDVQRIPRADGDEALIRLGPFEIMTDS